MKIEAGQWMMKEGLLYGRFGHPVLITKVVGKRVYYERMHRNSKGEIEERTPDYCHVKSVRYVVPTEEIGLKLWSRVYEIREDERRALAEVTATYNATGRGIALPLFSGRPWALTVVADGATIRGVDVVGHFGDCPNLVR